MWGKTTSLPKAGEFVVVKTTGPVEPWRPKAKNAKLRLALSAAYNTKTFDVTWDAAARTEFAKAAKEALRGFPFLAKIVEKRTTSRGVVLTASRIAKVSLNKKAFKAGVPVRLALTDFYDADSVLTAIPDASYIVELITSTSSETRILIPLDAKTAGYCNDIKKLHADLAGQA